jgi:hypothetical protein
MFKNPSNGAPERIRTSDLCLRRAALYPAELRARAALIAEAVASGNGALLLGRQVAGVSYGRGQRFESSRARHCSCAEGVPGINVLKLMDSIELQ